jgi:hypothetical protein
MDAARFLCAGDVDANGCVDVLLTTANARLVTWPAFHPQRTSGMAVGDGDGGGGSGGEGGGRDRDVPAGVVTPTTVTTTT